MKKGLLITFYCLSNFCYWVSAQSGISGELKTEYIPYSNYIRPEDSMKTNSRSDFRRVKLSLSIPLSVKKDDNGKLKAWSLLVGGSYARLSHKNYETPLFPDQMLNAQVGLQHIRPLGSGKWSIMLMGTVGVYTDLENINKDDILGQGAVVFIRQFNPNLAFGFGPGITTAFGIPMIMPFIYFDWKSGTKFKFSINFPESAEAGYQFSDEFALKAVIGLDGMTAERKKEGKSILLGYQQITAGLRPELKIGKSMTLRITGGTVLARSFSENDRSLKSIFKEKKQKDPSFTNSLYVAVALRWNLP
ncbi:DUF6268 family outer membrane beta-barrel protein [Elizabethkingia meningoseptica]|uniref:DUF6268 family outer membrane beta-barrel protein n=1 Tax=Elizabethkingia meningoseptica TaxID=238 RepID=UPI0038924227